ncbi:HD domain-containing protein [Brochothrix campestris]|uniref:HD domain-containing protein n=1 Tax=Brochothrix campestris FSL F6-1037 TaxID=1265861 RepID=W7D410_9LIST|nr:HD domain-containing protein [Brochothrix campestris]EUJ40013.1 hypothetical protein BCAMP_06195 [Brochothrix campestris FSL F6-1037]
MGIHHFFGSLADLELIVRCPGKFKYQPHNVAAHSFKVAQIAQFLGLVEEQAQQAINWRSLYEKALNHDYSELFIGDIKTPVKYASVELREMLSDVEETMTTNFIEKEVPERFQADFQRFFKEGKDESLEGQLLAVADKVDLLYESYAEIQQGNSEPLFYDIYAEALETILRYRHLASVTYFIDEILPDVLTQDEKSASQLIATTLSLLKANS